MGALEVPDLSLATDFVRLQVSLRSLFLLSCPGFCGCRLRIVVAEVMSLLQRPAFRRTFDESDFASSPNRYLNLRVPVVVGHIDSTLAGIFLMFGRIVR